jgi:hypothetical protein
LHIHSIIEMLTVFASQTTAEAGKAQQTRESDLMVGKYSVNSGGGGALMGILLLLFPPFLKKALATRYMRE